MAVLLLTMLVCLFLCAAIALYVAYPARGRALPPALTTARAERRGGGAVVPTPREQVHDSAQEARG